MSYDPENPVWKDGAEWGKKQMENHIEPSHWTKQTVKLMQEQINNIKINMAELNKDMKYLRSSLEQHVSDQKVDMEKIIGGQKESIEKIEVMFSEAMKEKADKESVEKKADKWVEEKLNSFSSTLSKVIVAVLIAGILGIVGIFLQMYLHLNKINVLLQPEEKNNEHPAYLYGLHERG